MLPRATAGDVVAECEDEVSLPRLELGDAWIGGRDRAGRDAVGGRLRTLPSAGDLENDPILPARACLRAGDGRNGSHPANEYERRFLELSRYMSRIQRYAGTGSRRPRDSREEYEARYRCQPDPGGGHVPHSRFSPRPPIGVVSTRLLNPAIRGRPFVIAAFTAGSVIDAWWLAALSQTSVTQRASGSAKSVATT